MYVCTRMKMVYNVIAKSSVCNAICITFGYGVVGYTAYNDDNCQTTTCVYIDRIEFGRFRADHLRFIAYDQETQPIPPELSTFNRRRTVLQKH